MTASSFGRALFLATAYRLERNPSRAGTGHPRVCRGTKVASGYNFCIQLLFNYILCVNTVGYPVKM